MAEAVAILLLLVAVILLPLLMVGGLALIRRWERAPQKRKADVTAAISKLEARVAALEAGQRVVSDIEERLDFVEAVLEGPPPPAQLGAEARQLPRE